MENKKRINGFKKISKKTGANIVIALLLLTLIFISIFLIFRKDIPIKTNDTGTTIYGMYIDENNQYEVRGNNLVAIKQNGEEYIIMELSNSQVKELSEKYSRGFVLNIGK